MKTKSLLILIIMAMSLLMLNFVGCNSQLQSGYTLVAPDGAPALAVASLIKSNKIGDKDFVTNIVSSNTIASEVFKYDFAIMPSNLAVKIANENQGDFQIICSVTNGNLYIVGAQEISNIQDLKGKLLLCIGQAAIPSLVTQAILKKNHLDINVVDSFDDVSNDVVSIKYCADGSEVISGIKAHEGVYGLLGEPAVSMAMSKGLKECIDLQQQWKQDTQSEIYGFPQSVMIGKKIAIADKIFAHELIQAMIDNQTYILDNSDVAIGNIKSIYDATSLKSPMSKAVLERCNIKTLLVSENKQYMNIFMQEIFKVSASSIGGQLPNENIYWVP